MKKIQKTLLVFLAALIGVVVISFVGNNEVFAKKARFSMTTGGMRLGCELRQIR